LPSAAKIFAKIGLKILAVLKLLFLRQKLKVQPALL